MGHTRGMGDLGVCRHDLVRDILLEYLNAKFGQGEGGLNVKTDKNRVEAAVPPRTLRTPQST